MQCLMQHTLTGSSRRELLLVHPLSRIVENPLFDGAGATEAERRVSFCNEFHRDFRVDLLSGKRKAKTEQVSTGTAAKTGPV